MLKLNESKLILIIENMNSILPLPKKILNFGHHVKSKLASLFSFVEFNQHGDEYQQAVMRLFGIGLTTLFVFSFYNEIRPITLKVIEIYSIVSIMFLLHIRVNSNSIQKRQFLTMLTDVYKRQVEARQTHRSRI